MIQPSLNAFGTLQRFARRPAAGEHCELCGLAVGSEHAHLLEPANRRLVCTCRACAILFSEQSGQRYKRVSERIQPLPGFQLDDAEWDSMLIPINMAFFFRSGATGKVTAAYPSPAGATESQLPLETWDRIAVNNPELLSMESDVEALLVNRLGASRGFPEHRYFLLPIDQCFKLVGLVRMHWRGLSGGEELWRELQEYFQALSGRQYA